MTKEEISKLSTEEALKMLPKYEDIMIKPTYGFYEKELNKCISPDNEEAFCGCGSSVQPLYVYRDNAVNTATDINATNNLSGPQLQGIGGRFEEAYRRSVEFYLQDMAYNNIILAIDNIPILQNSDFIYYSNIKKIIYDAIFNYGLYTSAMYSVLSATDNSRYTINPLMKYCPSVDRDLTRESMQAELNAYGDLMVDNLFLEVMKAVEFACDAFFYNFDMRLDPSIIDKEINTYLTKMGLLANNSPLAVTNRNVFVCTSYKTGLAMAIRPVIFEYLNIKFAEVFSVEEKAIPWDIYTSLNKIEVIEKQEKEKNNNGKIIPIQEVAVRDDYCDDLPFC